MEVRFAGLRLGLAAALALVVVLCAGTGVGLANTQSNNIAIVPSPTGAGHGGNLPTSNFPNGYAPSFTNVDPNTIADGTVADPLTGFDTVVLAQVCNIDTFLSDADFKTRIESFVSGGGKLLIWDSECVGTDYSKFVYPFTTDNPGASGANGTITDSENNSLGSNDPSSPFFVDYGLVGSGTDAVGDANVFTSFDQHYCADNQATNTNGTVGPVQVYAGFGNGLIIYDGLDYDTLSNGQGFDASSTSGAEHFGRIWLFNLLEPWNPQPASLPCGRKVFGIVLSPKTATSQVGTDHTLTAALTRNSAPEPNSPVTFTVTDGPNRGVNGTVNTDANGNASFTYRGAGGPGTDTIQAQGTLQTSQPQSTAAKRGKVRAAQAQGSSVVVTDTATKEWSAPPPAPVVPAAQGCRDMRKFTFLLHHGPRSVVVKAKVYVSGKAVKTVTGRNLTSVSINVLPQQDWTVRIVSTHSNGSKLVSVRRYHLCTKTRPKTTAHKHKNKKRKTTRR